MLAVIRARSKSKVSSRCSKEHLFAFRSLSRFVAGGGNALDGAGGSTPFCFAHSFSFSICSSAIGSALPGQFSPVKNSLCRLVQYRRAIRLRVQIKQPLQTLAARRLRQSRQPHLRPDWKGTKLRDKDGKEIGYNPEDGAIRIIMTGSASDSHSRFRGTNAAYIGAHFATTSDKEP
jgi:hypothetical protein